MLTWAPASSWRAWSSTVSGSITWAAGSWPHPATSACRASGRRIPMMMLFDAPDSLQDLAIRPTTTIAPQALLLMNSPIVRGYALALARAVSDQPDRAVQRAYAMALGRPPSEEELVDSMEFIH